MIHLAAGGDLDLLRLGRNTARGGVLIHRLVAVAIETMAYEALSDTAVP